MKRSSVASIATDLGYDPEEVSAIVFRRDDIEIREKTAKTDTARVWYILPEKDAPAFVDSFDQILTHLNDIAPVPLGDVTEIRLDWRGVSVQVRNGLAWQIPYTGEPDE